MVTKNEILATLTKVMDPELGRSLTDLNMVHDIDIQDGRVSFTLALTAPGCPMREQMASTSRSLLLTLPGVQQVEVKFRAMTDEERKNALGSVQPALPKLNKLNHIKQVIAVMSGKGGVGKSSVTGLLANGLAKRGYKVGVLDADITGPSIPRIFGLPPGGLRGNDNGILPAVTKTGIKVISANLLLKEEDKPIVWRGPMISSTIRQFWTDVIWGRLDTLLIDTPPGTSDAAISIMQNLPLNGAVLVTTPQELAGMVVRKAVYMLNEMHIPIIGVVENMSFFRCPDTGCTHEIFGPSHVEEIAQAANAPVFGRLPINPDVTALMDSGRMDEVNLPEMDAILDVMLAQPVSAPQK